jgi:hypothetical protein
VITTTASSRSSRSSSGCSTRPHLSILAGGGGRCVRQHMLQLQGKHGLPHGNSQLLAAVPGKQDGAQASRAAGGGALLPGTCRVVCRAGARPQRQTHACRSPHTTCRPGGTKSCRILAAESTARLAGAGGSWRGIDARPWPAGGQGGGVVATQPWGLDATPALQRRGCGRVAPCTPRRGEQHLIHYVLVVSIGINDLDPAGVRRLQRAGCRGRFDVLLLPGWDPAAAQPT